MAMVCAQCSQVFHGKERQCPKCGIPLLVQKHNVSLPDQPMVTSDDATNRWQQTPWGRIVVSVVIAQGLLYCMRLLFTAYFQANGEGSPWTTPEGMVWLNVFHAVALLACGMLAGANQERGITSGGLVGLWSGLIFLAINRASHGFLDPVVFFAQPFVAMVFGLIGGFIGYRIWKPVPLFNVECDLGKSGFGLALPNKKLWKGPIRVVRVLIGAAVAIAGAIFAKEILDFVIRNMSSGFSFKTYTAEKLVVYQTMAVMTFIGGAIAGSSARNGFKQGVCAGVLTAALYFGFQMANPKTLLEITVFTSLGAAGMCILGGIFGSMLFPPLAKEMPKKAIPY